MQLDEGRFPPAPHCPHVDFEELSHLWLGPAMVEDQADDLPLLRGEFFHLLVEQAPALEVALVVSSIRWIQARPV